MGCHSYGEARIRSYDGETDRRGVEDLERRCEVGPAERVFLFTDTLGDPICRIRNSPLYMMLVAEVEGELVGVIQGSIKKVTVHYNKAAPDDDDDDDDDLAKVGYVLGLRVAPLHRRRGIGAGLVCELEEWFTRNDVDYAYMATEKDNEASSKLFVDKLGYVKFRTPSILVQPVDDNRMFNLSPNVEIRKLKVEEAENLYNRFMASTEFFPYDIGNILRNKLSLGTWVAYPRGEAFGSSSSNNNKDNDDVTISGHRMLFPKSWAMLSVWNSGELFRLRLGRAPLSCLLYTKSSRVIDKWLPCFKLPALPDFYNPFGFYFMYGVHREGASSQSGKMVRALCHFVHNMAATSTNSEDCKVVVTEVGGSDSLRLHIPHWKLLSCPEDLWCIKPLKVEKKMSLHELTKVPPSTPLFVDPREV